jgi:hypothetical protein
VERDNRGSVIRTNGPNAGRRTISEQDIDVLLNLVRWGVHRVQDGVVQGERGGEKVLFHEHCGPEHTEESLGEPVVPVRRERRSLFVVPGQGGQDSEGLGGYMAGLNSGLIMRRQIA